MSAPSNFVGRQAALRWLTDRIAAASMGAGGIAVVSGPPGVGKTRLVQEGLVRCEHLWARSWEFGDAPAFWPIAQWIRGLDGRDPTLLGDDRAVLTSLVDGDEVGASRLALFHTVGEVLARAAAREPVVLVVDDLHAADRATLELLIATEPRWRNLPVLIIATRRTVDARTPPDAARLVARLCQLAAEHQLDGLDRDDVQLLARGLARRDLADDEVDSLMERAGGLPLFVEGLVRAAHGGPIRSGRLRMGFPRPLQALVEDRVAALPVDTREVLRLACLVPGRVEPLVLARALDWEVADVEDAIRVAVDEGLLRPQRDGLWWSHQVYAEAVEAGLGRSERREGHLALFHALDPTPATLAMRAAHAVAAGRPDGGALLMDAGARAERMAAHASAADLYQRAAQVAATPVARCDALLARARALRGASDDDGAREALEAAARMALAERAPEVAWALADIKPFGLRSERHVTLLRRALDALGPDEHARRAATLSRLARHEHDVAPSEQVFEPLIASARAEAEASGDPRVHMEVLVASLRYWREDRLATRLEVLRRLSGLREALRHPAQQAEIARWEYNIGLETCDGVAARTALTAHERAAAELRTPQVTQAVLIRRSILHQLEGRFDRIDPEALRVWSQRAGDPHAWFFEVSPQIYPAFLRGDREALASWRDGVVEIVQSAWGQFSGVALIGTWMQLQGGEEDAAVSVYHRWKAASFEAVPWWGHLQGLCVLAQIAEHLEDTDGAEVLVERLRAFPEGYGGCGPPIPFGPIARFEARLLRMLGRHGEASIAAERALRLCDRLGAPMIAGLVRQDADARPQSRTMAAPATVAEMIDEGGVWAFSLGQREARLRRTKGWEHLATLLERPGEPIHVLELSSGGRAAEVQGDAGAILDPQARQAYAARARALYEDLAEAESHNDLGRVDRIRQEIDALTEQLAHATGLGGRDRVAASAAERARTAVKQAIRRALEGLRPHLPDLADHIEVNLRTGMMCCYLPPRHGLRLRVTRRP